MSLLTTFLLFEVPNRVMTSLNRLKTPEHFDKIREYYHRQK
ncbi:unnamed protein product [Phyllotreta striolata]|uniref:Uncharacterized protein n=1 Tax=Phyllotreta striolata TaxID=444603 RepID=A0A9N9XIY5_PHYSR|nr:unnamed protein product [Phyllotreta striolata]